MSEICTTVGPAVRRFDPDGAVGASAIRLEGREKVTGAIRYATDVRLPGMLAGAVVRSPFPAARIRSIDVTDARAPARR